MSLAVTTAGAEAAPLLAALHQGGIGKAGPAWDDAAFAALLASPGRLALIAAEGDEPLGFLLLGLAADEGEIITLAVLPAARRRGLGAALVAAAAREAAARGAARLFLEVAEDNDPARALYARAGFVPVGRRRAYYARPGGAVDALLLALSLSS
ncbi:MAG: GNAT family N-acetyltransferase [Acetobacteraceae bacterium]|nr:GNAT family N-acetyltransferase [Acetobacteraceae bacterium]